MSATAITSWNGIVSPVFDAAATLLLVYDDGRRESLQITAVPLPTTIGLLKSKKVGSLICGAISALSLTMLQGNGISVISWIRGPIEEVLAAYKQGRLNVACYGMPGYRCGCMRRNRAGRKRKRFATRGNREE